MLKNKKIAQQMKILKKFNILYVHHVISFK
jgi:hypothetical protein